MADPHPDSPTSPSPRGVRFENIEADTITVGGHVVGGDLTIQYLTQGLNRLPTDYSGSIRNFLQEYLGSERRSVPFGGRGGQLAALDDWLGDPTAPPYALLVAEAGRGKSALLAHWLHWLRERGNHHLVFVPVSIRFNTALESIVFTALAARLGEVYGEPVAWTNLPGAAWRGVCQSFLNRTPPDGKPLLVILDGLDEAADWQAGADLFPLDPPPGVRVVVAARRLANCDEAGWRQRLNWTSFNLAQAIPLPLLDEKGLRDVLRQMGNPLDVLVTRVDVVRELHRLSEGEPLLVRLYVEALVAQGEHVAFLTPDKLAMIPPGLGGYLDRWWSEQRQIWGKDSPTREPGVRALLNLLAAALGPLDKEPLLDIAPPEAGLDAWTLDDALAPLGRFIAGDGVGQGYVFSHPRLGYHFWEKLTQRDRDAWEARFLRWGAESLQALNAGTLDPKDAPCYIIQHYGAHLERAKAPDEAFYHLVSEGWMRAWEALEGTYGGYLTDVARAWERVADEGSFLVSPKGRGRQLAMQVRYALCQSSVAALNGNIGADLLALAVRSKVYSRVQALVIARQIPESHQRAEALVALAPLMTEEGRAQLVQLACAIGDGWGRVNALTGIAPYLSEHQLQEVLESARTIEDEWERVNALIGLAPYLSEHQLQEVLEGPGASKNKWIRERALVGLIAHLSEDQRMVVAQEVPKAAWVTMSYDELEDKLVDLATRQSHSQLQKVLKDWGANSDESTRKEMSQGMAISLPQAQVQEALDAARVIRNKQARVQELKGLVVHLSGAQKAAVVQEALDVAQAIGDEGEQVAVCVELAVHLSQSQLLEALRRASTIEDEGKQSAMLRNLAEHLSQEQLKEAFKVARAIKDEWWRVRALLGLGVYLSQSQLQVALEAEASSMSDEGRRVEILVGLGKYLSQSQLQTALEVVRTIGDEERQAEALGGLEAYLSQNQLQEVLGVIREIEDEDAGTEALVSLAAHLSQSELQGALETIRTLRDEERRAASLSGLAAHLSQRQMQEALEVAQVITHEWWRAVALVGLAPYLSQRQLQEVLEVAGSIVDEWSRAELLRGLATYLSENQLQEALEIARAMWAEKERIETLVELAAYLPRNQLNEALDGLLTLRDSESITRSLVGLVAHLSQHKLQEALEVTQAIEDELRRGEVLVELAAHLSQSQLLTALEVARAIRHEGKRAGALSGLVGYLAEDQKALVVQEALAAAGATGDRWHRAEALSALVPSFLNSVTSKPSSAYNAWITTLPILAARPRPEFLNDLAVLMPFVLALAGEEAPQAAQGIFEAIQEVCTWWP